VSILDRHPISASRRLEKLRQVRRNLSLFIERFHIINQHKRLNSGYENKEKTERCSVQGSHDYLRVVRQDGYETDARRAVLLLNPVLPHVPASAAKDGQRHNLRMVRRRVLPASVGGRAAVLL